MSRHSVEKNCLFLPASSHGLTMWIPVALHNSFKVLILTFKALPYLLHFPVSHEAFPSMFVSHKFPFSHQWAVLILMSITTIERVQKKGDPCWFPGLEKDIRFGGSLLVSPNQAQSTL